MPTNPLQIQLYHDETDDDREIWEIKNDTQKALSRFYDDMYNIERLRFQAFFKMLIDAKIITIPSVQAAAPPSCPEKPPPMKYTDLPLYKSPHMEYKDYMYNKEKCPKARVKLIHEFLYPHVRYYRRLLQKTYLNTKCAIEMTAKDICTVFCENKRNFKCKMRNPDNLLMRQAVVIMGGTAGYFLGAGRSTTRRLLSTSVGLLISGALCFPDQTDAAFRSISYMTAKVFIGIYNTTCKKQFALRERIPCPEDVPPPPPIRNDPCAKKK